MAAKKKDEAQGENAAEGEPKGNLLPVHYFRSNQFRIVTAHGFMAGHTGMGESEIHLALWTQHPAYPKLSGLQYEKDGTVTGEVGPVNLGLERELEIGILMSRSAARSLIAILVDQLGDNEARQNDDSSDSTGK